MGPCYRSGRREVLFGNGKSEKGLVQISDGRRTEEEEGQTGKEKGHELEGRGKKTRGRDECHMVSLPRGL